MESVHAARRIACMLALVAAVAVPPADAAAQDPAPAAPRATLSQFGAGSGPAADAGTYRLLDAAATPLQSNAVAFDVAAPGARASFELRCKLHVTAGGDGGAFVFLNTAEYGARGPAPFVPDWTAPNLRGTFAVGIDVHDPKNEEPFGPWGNYQGLPEREVSLHWDGRELVKRVADTEFRSGVEGGPADGWADVAIVVRHVVGGADVSVRIGASQVYDGFFVADLHPYEMRPAIGAGTRADATTQFDVRDLRVVAGAPAAKRRPPVRVEVFHHALTDSAHTAYTAEVDLPDAMWAFGRVVMTLEIHDAGRSWDEWDRNGEVSVWDDAGEKRGIVQFITSYRTPCRWQVDVTQFRPLLAGHRRLEVAAGTNFYKNRGFEMSVTLDFHHGVPDLEPFRVVPLWTGTAHYGSAANHFRDFFAPQTVAIDAETRAARVFVSVTGHSQVGEFTPSGRTIEFRPEVGGAGAGAGAPADAGAGAAGAVQRFENTLWKTDCYLNPNRPQFGTWKYSRAGWAPGDVVRPWTIDLTPHLRAGRTAEFRYEPTPYAFDASEPRPADEEIAKANQVVRAYLVLYRVPSALRPAPTLRILEVAAGGSAAKAGVQAGDWLALYDGAAVDSTDELRARVQAAEAAGKKTVPVVFFRGAERLEFEFPVGRLGVGLGAQ